MKLWKMDSKNHVHLKNGVNGDLRTMLRTVHGLIKKRKRLLDTIYCMIYFVDNKYDMYISSHKPYLKALMPLVMVYKHIAKMRMKYHITAFPIEIFGKKNMIYRILTGSD